MAKLLSQPEEVPATSSAWSETRNRYPKDNLLRRRGFTIHKRPEKGEPLWTRDGKTYTQSEALELVKRESGS